MASIAISREVHKQIRESLKQMSGDPHVTVKVATKHGVSIKTVQRVRRGGDHYIGYKRVMAHDHNPKVRHDQYLTEPLKDDKRSFFKRLKIRVRSK